MTSKLKTDVLETVSGSGTIALTNQLSGMTSASMPSGSVLQVVSVTKSDTFTYTGSTTFQDVTGLAATITPLSTSSKILVELNINLSGSQRYHAAKILRGSTQIGMGDASSNRPQVTVGTGSNNDESNQEYMMRNSSASYLDSPSTTSATTYKIQVGNSNNASSVTYVNRTPNDSDHNWAQRGISTITITEIKG